MRRKGIRSELHMIKSQEVSGAIKAPKIPSRGMKSTPIGIPWMRKHQLKAPPRPCGNPDVSGKAYQGFARAMLAACESQSDVGYAR